MYVHTTHTFTSVYTLMSTAHTPVCVYKYVCVQLHIHTHVLIHLHLRIHTNTHTHAYTHTGTHAQNTVYGNYVKESVILFIRKLNKKTYER